jgi:hypothetical protein
MKSFDAASMVFSSLFEHVVRMKVFCAGVLLVVFVVAVEGF